MNFFSTVKGQSCNTLDSDLELRNFSVLFTGKSLKMRPLLGRFLGLAAIGTDRCTPVRTTPRTSDLDLRDVSPLEILITEQQLLRAQIVLRSFLQFAGFSPDRKARLNAFDLTREQNRRSIGPRFREQQNATPMST